MLTEFQAQLIVTLFGVVLIGVICVCLFYGLRYFLLPQEPRPNLWRVPR